MGFAPESCLVKLFTVVICLLGQYISIMYITLTNKYMTRVRVTDSDKHASLQCYQIYYDRKQFYDTGPWSSTQLRQITF
jgi:hypothetical protein